MKFMVAFELIKYFTQLSQPFLSFLFSLRMRKEMKRKELRCLLPKGTVQLIQFLLKKLIGCCSCGACGDCGFSCLPSLLAARVMGGWPPRAPPREKTSEDKKRSQQQSKKANKKNGIYSMKWKQRNVMELIEN